MTFLHGYKLLVPFESPRVSKRSRNNSNAELLLGGRAALNSPRKIRRKSSRFSRSAHETVPSTGSNMVGSQLIEYDNRVRARVSRAIQHRFGLDHEPSERMKNKRAGRREVYDRGQRCRAQYRGHIRSALDVAWTMTPVDRQNRGRFLRVTSGHAARIRISSGLKPVCNGQPPWRPIEMEFDRANSASSSFYPSRLSPFIYLYPENRRGGH